MKPFETGGPDGPKPLPGAQTSHIIILEKPLDLGIIV
jgi:hypothetical protein